MHEADRVKLLGTYRTPRFEYGTVVTCAIRGPVKIVGLTVQSQPTSVVKIRQEVNRRGIRDKHGSDRRVTTLL